jgi:predicted nucleic acid-binding protein
MKILLDTNIIFSAFVTNSKFLKNLLCLCLERKHKIFIDDYSMNELNDVLNRKKINIERNVQIINSIMDIPMINFLVTNKEN